MKKNTIFGQIVQLLSREEFSKIVRAYNTDKYTKTLDCWQQLMVLLYSQIKDLKSLREIETSLKSHKSRWEALGLVNVARSTLADANAGRSSEIYEKLFYSFLEKCRQIAPSHRFSINMPVYTQDATLIPLCLSVFPWAKFRKRKGALKIHMLLDHQGCLPSFIRMTNGKCHEVNVVKKDRFGFPELPSDSILTVDRGYMDYKWLYSLHQKGVLFIIPAKSNMACDVIGQHKKPVESRGIISDELIELTNFYQSEDYPEPLRRIEYHYIDDKGQIQIITVLTNNLNLAASTIAALYKGRWEIETFFRWIKQNLRIKTFIGTSENAVMTQVWVAMILYLLLSFIKFQTRFKASLSELLRIFREVLLETNSFIEYFRTNWDIFVKKKQTPTQLSLL
ncbi:MAG TPA: IS4 family transposase [Clostridia bacterium]